jgi:ATP-dependent Clp protease, protease subunit
MFEKMNVVTIGKKQVSDSFFLLFGEINTETAQSTVEWILGMNYTEENKPEVLTMMINSPGGELAAAWAIIDVMRGSSIPIRTVGVGEIASAGLMIFAAGTKGMRVLSENTSIMSHQYSTGMGGKYHELLAVQKEHSNIQERMVKYFKKTTDMTEANINKYLLPSHDVWLTAEEAKHLGLCDEVKSLK